MQVANIKEKTRVMLPRITNILADIDGPDAPRHVPFSEIIARDIIPQSKHIKGFWRPEEDDLLRAAVSECNPIVWDVIATKVPGRTPIQCKERWLYRLHPGIKLTRFEQWEDELIIRERERVGNQWTYIANRLPGRTSCAVKNRWYSVLRNRVF